MLVLIADNTKCLSRAFVHFGLGSHSIQRRWNSEQKLCISSPSLFRQFAIPDVPLRHQYLCPQYPILPIPNPGHSACPNERSAKVGFRQTGNVTGKTGSRNVKMVDKQCVVNI